MSPRKPIPRDTPPKETGSGSAMSQDRERHIEGAQHHPYGAPQPHAPHHTVEKPTLPHRHYPHTTPPEFALDIDHGTHEDRPRPGKIAKKGTRKGSPR